MKTSLHDAEISAEAAPSYTPSSRPASPDARPLLTGASAVWQLVRERCEAAPVEEFLMLALDTRHRLQSLTMNARGSLTGVEVHPRDVFRPLIAAGAAAVIFVHNHPSGDPTPSRADIELTQRLRDVGDLCGIPVLDHVVVGRDSYASLAERNWK
jgi:DNA repair protein RadC